MATYVPVTVVPSGGAPFVQVSGNAAPMTVVPNAAPITLVQKDAPGVVLYNPDGSPYTVGPVLTAGQRANAMKIIETAQAYAPRTVMASPPTISSAASSQIGSSNDGMSATSIAWLDATKIRSSGPFSWKNVGATFQGVQGTWSHDGANTFGSGGPFVSEFSLTGSQFELAVGNVTDDTNFSFGIRIVVDGQWTKASQYVKADFGSFSNGFRVLRFNFGSTATRRITVYASYWASPAYLNIAPGASVSLPTQSANEPLTRYIGDSYVEYRNVLAAGSDVSGSTAMAISEQLGIAVPAMAGRSSQGFVQLVDGYDFATRIALDVGLLTTRTHEIFQASINDNAASDASITAKVLSALQTVRAAEPDACQTLILPFSVASSPTPAAKYNAAKAGALAFAATDPAIVIIETNDLPTVQNGALLPNSSTQVNPDTAHPGIAWTSYIAPIIKSRIVSAWQAKTA